MYLDHILSAKIVLWYIILRYIVSVESVKFRVGGKNFENLGTIKNVGCGVWVCLECVLSGGEVKLKEKTIQEFQESISPK